MLRADRTLTENMFECGVIKVLVCTATLAWGVNLPAHTVVVKGTELYDPERGGYVDLSILDVLQIFGRAGRPQYDTSGHAILITPHASMGKYLTLLGEQAPIESNFIKALPDHLNAEIVNGTVNNLREAIKWLTYTFLYIRMCKNPMVYGISLEERAMDGALENKRYELIKSAVEKLDSYCMIRFDQKSGNLGVTDLGRIASHYYIQAESINNFNMMLNGHISHMESLNILCASNEFQQLKLRPEELTEIEQLKLENNLNVTVDDTSGKVNVLIHSYMSHKHISGFTLQSDTNYIATNASRISRALFEIALKRGWSAVASYYLTLSKGIDSHIDPFNHPPLR